MHINSTQQKCNHGTKVAYVWMMRHEMDMETFQCCCCLRAFRSSLVGVRAYGIAPRGKTKTIWKCKLNGFKWEPDPTKHFLSEKFTECHLSWIFLKVQGLVGENSHKQKHEQQQLEEEEGKSNQQAKSHHCHLYQLLPLWKACLWCNQWPTFPNMHTLSWLHLVSLAAIP